MTDLIRIAVVTGAASGIGEATCRCLARDGFQVAAFDRDASRLGQLAESMGPSHFTAVVDVADAASVAQAFTDVDDRWSSSLSVLATCAGICDTRPLSELSAMIFAEVQQVNLIGTFLAVKEAARRMRSGARICTVSSVAALRGGGIAGTSAYASSKAGVIAFTKSMARELGPRGIAVNSVAPALIRTPMLSETMPGTDIVLRATAQAALGREGDAYEVAEAIVWLLSTKASFVTGVTLPVDGGLVMF